MRIQTLQWYPYGIPLLNTLNSAHEALAIRRGVIVEITTDNGLTGYGESAPLPNFSGGTLQEVLTSLEQVAEHLHHMTITAALQFITQHTAELATAALCGLETALLDLQGQHTNHPLYQLLAYPRVLTSQETGIARQRQSIPVNMVIGAQAVPETIIEAQQAMAQGYTCIKIKIGSDIAYEIERIAAIRHALGPHVRLRLDANEALNSDQAYTLLSRCVDFDLQYIEQPLPRSMLAEMRELREHVSVPIAADEAITDLDSAQRVLAAQAADILIIKPQLAGSLHVGRQIIQAASAHHVQAVITSSIDAGIGITAALHLAAASPEVTLECGLATLNKLADDLIIEDLIPLHGIMNVPAGPGLGVRLDRAALTHYSS